MTRAYNTATTQQNSGGALSPITAGKNACINGGFDIWQRGTSFASSASSYIYTSDRWLFVGGSFATGRTLSRQASGLTGIQYCGRLQRDSGNTSTQPLYLHQTLETAESLRFAGQTITLSFYARVGANYSGSNSMSLIIASGTGTDQQVTSFTGNANIYSNTFTTLSTSWQRFTATVAVGSTATELGFYFFYTPSGTAGAADYLETTGFQLELGSVATPFSRAGGTIQGELAACQRYFIAYNNVGSGSFRLSLGLQNSTTTAIMTLALPVSMRTIPSASFSAIGHWTVNNYINQPTLTSSSINTSGSSNESVNIAGNWTSAIGSLGAAIEMTANNTAARYYLSSEL